MKTIFYAGTGNARRAVIALDDRDLNAIGCGDYRDLACQKDPASELDRIVTYDRRAAARIVTDGGPMHVVGAALAKLEEYLKAAPKITGLEPIDPATEAIEESKS